MIKIRKHRGRLLLTYIADGFGFQDAGWIDNRLKEYGSVTLRRVFTFTIENLLRVSTQNNLPEDSRTFLLGAGDGNFYRIDRAILGLKHDLRLSKSMSVSEKTFVATRDISIFGKIDALIDEPIVVGDDQENAIPIAEFLQLQHRFPNSTELTHYSYARISRVLKEYFGTMSDAQNKFERYLNKNKSTKARQGVGPGLEIIREYEIQKFEYIRDELRKMLDDYESYVEKDWQDLIVSFLLFIFPKYVAVLPNLQIKDFYSDSARAKSRFIDVTLVDADGNLDIVEIKRPFLDCLLSRTEYRGNYTPKSELSGSVMQVEKYLFHLSKWGRDGEIAILKKRKADIPRGMEIKVTNPSAMIILGRDSHFNARQRFDFEIIKRKYRNIADIMTYDDLLRRLDNIIQSISRINTAYVA